MSMDLILKPACVGCGSRVELYGSSCKHMTLCMNCGKSFAATNRPCYDCLQPITKLIREYNVRACSTNDKNYFIGRFTGGLPDFKTKKNENKWSLQKEGLQGRQVSDTLREKFKNRPWLLEDETGVLQYQGQLEGSQSATYYLLMLIGKEFVAIPAGSWYNFTKVAQYKQLTLEEAEEKMANRRKTADGYERWMMKAANNGAAAFGELEIDRQPASGGGKGGRKKSTGGDEDEGKASDKGDKGKEVDRKSRLGLKISGGDDEEGLRGGDFDFDDDDIEKGDDWEHTEIFTDDDDTPFDPEEREHLAPEIPLPPEIKQDDDDEVEEEAEGGLSKSGKELKKLLGKSNGLEESDDDDSDDMEDDILPVKKDAPKEEPVENPNSAKTAAPSGVGRGTPPASKNSKGKRKSNGDESKQTNGTPLKKAKTENGVKSVKDEPGYSSRNSAAPRIATSSASTVTGSTAPRTGPVTEDEIREILLQKKPVTTQDLVAKFRSRLRSNEDKGVFTATLRKICKMQKPIGGLNYVVLREHKR